MSLKPGKVSRLCFSLRSVRRSVWLRPAMNEIDQHAKFQRAWARDRLLVLAEGMVLVLVGVGLLFGGAWIGLTMSGHRYTEGKPWIAWSIGGLMGIGGCIFGVIGRRQMAKEARFTPSLNTSPNAFSDLCSAVSQEFNEATPWPENRSSVFFNEGRFLLSSGEHQKAYEIFSELESEIPGNAVLECCLAECLRKLGRCTDAVARLEQLKISRQWTDPVAAFVEFKCAEALLDAGMSDLAIDRIGTVRFLGVDQRQKAMLLDHLATRLIASGKQGDGARGLELAKQAFDLDPSSVTIGATLAWFLVDTAEDGKADEMARAALQKSDLPVDQAMSAFALAKIHWKRCETKEAERLAAFARYAMPEGPLRQTVEQRLANL